MATLKEIKRRISSVESTRQITKAMKMVAASKLRKAQGRMQNTRPYAAKLNEIISLLLHKVEVLQQLLIAEREVRSVCVIVVTADRGLCGAFNSNIIKKAVALIADLDKEYRVKLITIGRKGYEYFKKRGYNVIDNQINIFNHLQYEHATTVVKNVVKYYEAEKFDRVLVVFNEFKSALQQNQRIEQFLPIPFTDEEVVKEKHSLVEPLFDPDEEFLFNLLIPKNLDTQMWRYLVESNAAEEAARMAAMESATDNATELINDLTIVYNRTRQAAITTEIAEIVGGAEALKG